MRLLTNSMICFAVVVDKNGTPHDLNSAATIAAPAPLVDQLIPLIQAADNDFEPTSRNKPPHAALDSVLGQTGHLILDFDGLVCDLFAGTPIEAIAAHLRDVLRAEPIKPPTAIAETTDLFEIFSYAASISPGLAARAENVMAYLELNAVVTAAPASTFTTPSPPAASLAGQPPSSAAIRLLPCAPTSPPTAWLTRWRTSSPARLGSFSRPPAWSKEPLALSARLPHARW
jgi:hypothetical protein